MKGLGANPNTLGGHVVWTKKQETKPEKVIFGRLGHGLTSFAFRFMPIGFSIDVFTWKTARFNPLLPKFGSGKNS